MTKNMFLARCKLGCVCLVAVLTLAGCGSEVRDFDNADKQDTTETETVEMKTFDETEETAPEDGEVVNASDEDVAFSVDEEETTEEDTADEEDIHDETDASAKEETTDNDNSITADNCLELLQGVWMSKTDSGDCFIAIYEDGTVINGYINSDLFPPFGVTNVEVNDEQILLSLHTDGTDGADAGYDGYEASDSVSTLTSDDGFVSKLYWNSQLMIKVDDNPDNYKNTDTWDNWYTVYESLEND